MTVEPYLPVHGFVLAGGKSSRMGRDKATLLFAGKPLVQRATEKLETFCAHVAIAGNRPDLKSVAPVVFETRSEAGPIAGLEAGLGASSRDWALFVPVDVPYMPEALLRTWAAEVLTRAPSGVRLSFLQTGGIRQPSFSLLHRECLTGLTRVADRGIFKLRLAFEAIALDLGSHALWITEVMSLLPSKQVGPDISGLFANLNTPEQLQELSAACRDSEMKYWL